MIRHVIAKFFILLSALLLCVACGGGGGSAGPPPVVGNQWTVMVYMAADNDLDVASAPLDIQEMLTVGSSANVTVLLQYDTRTTPTRLYRVEKGSLALLHELGELNMASGDTLRDFITFGVKNYPARHYALILWDHGNGWESGVDGSGFIAPTGKRVLSLLEDWNNTNIKGATLPNVAVAKGIGEAEAITGIKLDILGVDACLMATIEAAYEFRNSAAILVASQDVVQGYGWDYHDLLGRLTANPLMSARELAVNMVDSYRQFAESPAWGYGDQAIAALTLGAGMETLAREVDALARRLKASLDDPATRDAARQRIADARAGVQGFWPPTYVDLDDFSALLEPTASLTPVQEALRAITIAAYHGAKRPNAHGLDIVFYDLPAAVLYSVYQFDYANYDLATGKGSHSSFINDFTWDEMMAEFFKYQYPDLVK
jgi:hypothetical protein